MAVTVHSPAEGFTGVVAGVAFADGVASDVTDGRALAYFRRHGYGIEQGEDDSPGDDSDDLDQLRADAAELGIEVNNRWREKRLREEIDAKLAEGGEG